MWELLKLQCLQGIGMECQEAVGCFDLEGDPGWTYRFGEHGHR